MIGLVLSCEHASWRLPPGVDLGVADADLQSQAGWDHGALDITAAVARALAHPFRAGVYSRVWVDLNRAADHPDVIPASCYGLPVPGNAALDEAARRARLAAHHTPYWDAVRADVHARLGADGACLHLSVHSFSPELDPVHRQFDLGVLFDPTFAFETSLAAQLRDGLRAAGFDVRDNAPYAGVGPAVVTTLRGEFAGRAYAGIEIEVSHAVTRRPGGCAAVATALVPLLGAIKNRS